MLSSVRPGEDVEITADSTFVSADAQLTSYGDSLVTGTFTTILAVDVDGNVIEVGPEGILGTQTDSVIYRHNGTLTGDRTLTGANQDLTFSGINVFQVTGDSVDVNTTNVDLDGTNYTADYTDITSAATATNATSGADVTVTATSGNTTVGANLGNTVINAPTGTIDANATTVDVDASGTSTITSVGVNTIESSGGDVVISASGEDVEITADSTFVSADAQLTSYGDSLVTGTFTTILAVDVDGNVIEVGPEGILGTQTDSVIYRHNGTLTDERYMTMSTYDLHFVEGTDTTIITSDGRMAIGRGSVTQGTGTANDIRLDVNGDILAIQVHSSSDERFKKDIVQVSNAVEKVQAINGVTYNFRTEEFANRNFPESKQLGFIAQNVEEVLPEVVKTDAEGFKSIDYAKLTALLNEAIKEQQKEIDALSKKLKDANKYNEHLADEIASIKQMIIGISNLAESDED